MYRELMNIAHAGLGIIEVRLDHHISSANTVTYPFYLVFEIYYLVGNIHGKFPQNVSATFISVESS